VGDLSVIVRLHGSVVENRVLEVARVARIGESPSADVPFPGADLQVTRTEAGLHIRGRTLAEGDELTIQLGKIEVKLEHTMRTPVPHEWTGQFDSRFLLVLVLVAVSATWLDAFDAWATVHLPAARGTHVVDQLVHSVWPARPDTNPDDRQVAAVAGSEARLQPVTITPIDAEGPRHHPDDRSTGIRWYRWYRDLVPGDAEQLDAAVAAHIQDPYDPDARALLGQAAYNADRFEEAARQYAFIVEHHPEDPDARLHLAAAEMRRGNHTHEIRQLEAALRRSPEDIAARAALAVALTRLERLDEAAVPLDELRVEHPRHPLTLLTEAKIAALDGRDADALDFLDDTMDLRTTLSASWRLELRRDIALDPAFARLRKDVRLRSVINRHLGAAGPRPIR